MILIKKAQPLPELEAEKEKAKREGLSDKEAYGRLKKPLKDQVRDALMREQGHLCAYCMRRLPDERITEEDADLKDIYIEHWKAISAERTSSENKGLDYNNMLAVCSGNEKAPETTGKRKRRFFTCDKKRGNAALTINPLDLATLETIYYSSDGRIESTDKVINDDINTRLNLNCSSEAVTLPQNRKSVLDAIQADVLSQDGDLLQNCIDQLHMWESESDPKTPYIGIGIWWLRDQIAHMEKQ